MNKQHALRPILSLVTALLWLSGCKFTTPVPVEPTSPPQPTAAATSILPPTPTLAPTTPPAGAYERNARLGRGVNLGNALEAPNEGDWGIVLQESDFQLIKDAGFTAVRVPIRWSAHAELNAPYTIDPAFFKRIDWVIQQAFSRGLAVVINMHNYDELIQALDKYAPRFIALWQQIAAHYQDYQDDLYFEPLNEPNSMSAEAWNKLLGQCIAAIRATNPKRTLIVGPVDWNSHWRLKDLELPAGDRNLIVTFHYYLPFQFTHQGAEWVDGSNAWLGTTWDGTSSQRSEVDFDLDVAAQWGKDNDRPIYLGEFGAYSKGDMPSRARWTAYVARQAEARHMSWAYWEFRSGFGVYDGTAHQWNDALKTALLPAP